MPSTRFLNAFRALAALWVVVGHCLLWGGVRTAWLPAPGLAVDLFMVISGFLMVLTVERDQAEGWTRRFYLRRFFRIAPAYYAALLFAFVFQGPMRAGMSILQTADPAHWLGSPYVAAGYSIGATELVSHVSFLFGLWPSQADATMLPDWSLSLEMQFYAVFPLLFIISRRRHFVAVALAIAFVCAAAAGLFSIGARHGLWPPFPEPSNLMFKLPIFLIGMLIHDARNKGWQWAAVAVGLLATIEFRAAQWTGFSVVSLVALLAGCWLFQWRPRLFRSNLITFASDCSYSVYLIHMPVLLLLGSSIWSWLSELGAGQATLAMSLVVIPVSYVLSWASFRYIEQPGIALGKSLSGRRAAIAPPMT